MSTNLPIQTDARALNAAAAAKIEAAHALSAKGRHAESLAMAKEGSALARRAAAILRNVGNRRFIVFAS